MKWKLRMKKLLIDCGFLIQFAVDDFKGKYAGSFLGITWAFLQPLSTILVYWFVFQLGFRSQPVENVPFILWLISGLIPWFFINEAIIGGTASLVEYSYLVKKVLFNINILPLAKITSTFFVQIFLILVTALAMLVFGFYPNVYYLEVFFYAVYTVLLVTAISYFTSAVYVFFKDVLQMVSIILQLIFWLTPMVWDISIMPDYVQKIVKLNPIYYVVFGYRNAFIYQKPLFSEGWLEVYYWVILAILMAVGVGLFKKVKPHFADVL